jgi:hypothetical protein
VPAYVLDFYVDALGNVPARDWLRALEPRKKFAAGHAMEAQLQQDGLGVCRTRWGKNLGGGVAEFRVSEPQRATSYCESSSTRSVTAASWSCTVTTKVRTPARTGNSAKSVKPGDA